MTEHDEAAHRAGVYTVLERPGVYQRFQSLIGGPAALARFVREFVRPVEGMRLLDVGCGTGQLLEHLPAGVDYTGFDMNAAYIEAGRRRYGDRARFFRARIGEEPPEIANGKFDMMVAVGVLHHLDDGDCAHLLRTAARILGADGVFVSLDGTLHSGQSPLSRLMAKLDRGGKVRSPDAYRRLVEPHLPHVESWVLTGWLNIPYSYCVMRAKA